MNEEITLRRPGPGPVTALRTPFQTPAVDRTSAGDHGRRDGTDGVEPNLPILPLLGLAGSAIGSLFD
ncbi:MULTISPECIES: hypothetical protein [Streptomyces]|uniref:Uncharacterized protein n=1 Tax=Streptomyces koelreuteriae TaxID=2838015 RepID=A0ABX8G2G6_9ACTN|nr:MULTISPECIES: hypothetical protein [Streptomyces]QWB27362.1 hypothetical protein KJK29_34800 [Streptomyces koelreuteriae]UUA10446.1 hypothetical protein NNW98_34995 [Streptomyces koelreuteriae]UUA18053.1 hypothetical protein NNW99_34880 [Streptomyces sp. CRCS-T-1]